MEDRENTQETERLKGRLRGLSPGYSLLFPPPKRVIGCPPESPKGTGCRLSFIPTGLTSFFSLSLSLPLLSLAMSAPLLPNRLSCSQSFLSKSSSSYLGVGEKTKKDKKQRKTSKEHRRC
ncbi:hypothetical protein BO85DRAFT_451532, partial [Aspergillus piperis CBS 112811]